MVSNAKWVMLASRMLGRSLAGVSESPWTTVSRLKPARKESRPGILIPPSIVPSGWSRPKRYSGWSGAVSQTISMAANFTGCSWYTVRARASPTMNWTGVTIAATVNGTRKPSRW